MRFESFAAPERSEDDKIAKLAESAHAFRRTWEWPYNVYKALDQAGIRDIGERKAYFSKVAKAMKDEKRLDRLAEDAVGSEAAKYEAEEREREKGEE